MKTMPMEEHHGSNLCHAYNLPVRASTVKNGGRSLGGGIATHVDNGYVRGKKDVITFRTEDSTNLHATDN